MLSDALPSQSTLQAKLSAFIDKSGVPAAGAGIIDQKGVLLAQCSGQYGRDDSTRVVADDLWHIGSCNKAITAVLFALLVERGKVGWRSTLSQVFPDLLEHIHPAYTNTPLDDLFYCRSGMPANPSAASMRRLWNDNRELTVQRTELTCTALAEPPRNPGKFRYSNLGYIALGAVIDRVAGMSYEKALQSLLFKPLGIETAGFGAPPRIKGHAALLRLPWLHALRGKPCDPADVQSDNPAVFSSAGTLHISLPDWAKFLSQFLLDKQHSIIPDSVIESVLEAPEHYQMTRGLGRVSAPGASFAMQGSNTMWIATAILSENRDKLAIVTCNDGRSRLLQSTAVFALDLLQRT